MEGTLENDCQRDWGLTVRIVHLVSATFEFDIIRSVLAQVQTIVDGSHSCIIVRL